MSDTVYNVKKYLTFTHHELIGVLATCLFAAFGLTFNDWGDETFSIADGLWSFGLMLVFLLLVFALTLWACKAIAVRMGYVIRYQPHVLGLFLGVIVTVGSAGYLPLFLPGGFKFERPERLMIGHWRGFYKEWEMGLISATFPLVTLLWVALIGPLYLITQAPIYLSLMLGVILTAFYSLAPLPMIVTEGTGRTLDIFSHFRGTTFGLDVIWASIYWYGLLLVFTVVFGGLAYLLTIVGIGAGFALYAILLFMMGACTFIYSQFMKK